MKPIRTFHLPSGRIILSKTEDGYPIESTVMQDVSLKEDPTVRDTLEPHVIWKHLVPVKEKLLGTVSTQKGCVHNCKFCDVATLPFKGNLSINEIMYQLEMLVATTPDLLAENGTKKFKLGFSRMGEPGHNLSNVLFIIKQYMMRKEESTTKGIYSETFNRINPAINWLPCFNSILPRKTLESKTGFDIIDEVLECKERDCKGFLHFQISCNSTDEEVRKKLFGGAEVLTLEEIIAAVNNWNIFGRTVTLNFIVMKGVPLDVKYLMKLGLNPQKFVVKLIPLNTTKNSEENELKTRYDYSTYEDLKKYAEEFTQAGIPIVFDATCKAENHGLCCGELAHIYA